MNARREPPRRRAMVNVITTIATTRFSHAPRENENRMPAARNAEAEDLGRPVQPQQPRLKRLAGEEQRRRDQVRAVDVGVLEEPAGALVVGAQQDRRARIADVERDRGGDRDRHRADDVGLDHQPGAARRVDVAADPDADEQAVRGHREVLGGGVGLDRLHAREQVERDEEHAQREHRERHASQLEPVGDDRDRHHDGQHARPPARAPGARSASAGCRARPPSRSAGSPGRARRRSRCSRRRRTAAARGCGRARGPALAPRTSSRTSPATSLTGW